MNIALLTAGGTGSRMHQEIPKQFIHVNNKPIIIYTLEAFEKNPNIDAIIVAVLQGWDNILWAYAKQYHITKLKWMVTGGKTGQESIHNCLSKLMEEKLSKDTVVMIHDGNRPLISQDIIADSLATYKKYGSAVAAIPCVEVVFKSKSGISSHEFLNREELFRTQTPHTYTLGALWSAHKEWEERNLPEMAATCSLMSTLGKEVFFSKGSEKNIKITTLEDLEIFEALIHFVQGKE